MQIEDQCKKGQIDDIGFINPNTINEWLVKKRVKDTEDNLLQSLLRHQNKAKILFPYNSSECYCLVHIRFRLLEVIVM